MVKYVIYGKVIVDDIRLRDGRRVRGTLGGGGPQAAFGARLWSDSVGLLTRTGSGFEDEHAATLRGLDVDLQGWQRFPDIPTPRVLMQYDDKEYLAGGGLITSQADWGRLLAQPLTLPPSYQAPRAIHLITEFPDEPMVATARELRDRGALLSLEPLLANATEPAWDAMLALMPTVDIVCPDWPTASTIAASDDPGRVLRHWAALGPACVAVRHGAHGSYVWGRARDEAWHVPAVPSEVVDPTGAGNAYCGGLCVGWAEKGEALLAGCQGAISAALIVRHVGLPAMSAALEREAREGIERAVETARRM